MSKELPITTANEYHTPPTFPCLVSRCSPTLAFYPRLLWIIVRSGLQARFRHYNGNDWALSSVAVLRALERVGCTLEITGLENFYKVQGPCVFVSNHMSTLETFVLPCIIQPLKDTTFVVKQGLLSYPFFRHILGARNPIVVGRKNPRDDLKIVLEQGVENLKRGRSIIIFPQSTRSLVFQREHFNTIGIKLAKQAGVPILPIALKTDAWSESEHFIKDFGRIYPERTIYFAFGEALRSTGQGKEEHRQICDFITQYLEKIFSR